VERLTPAECGVLELLLQGNTNSRIASSRGTTLRTVSKQVDAVYKKLEVHSRGELAQRFGSTE
jgi:DNA-binding NarL/FixJ family response regulator